MEGHKFGSLPDNEEKSPEIYETPELTDDGGSGSNTPIGTLREASPSPSHRPPNGYGLDKSRFNQDEARQRFERSRVDARGVNFSDSIAGRRSYKIRAPSRRRRTSDGTEEIGDLSDEEEESLDVKIARLQREAEEVRLELSRREEQPANGEVVNNATGDSFATLNGILNGLKSSSQVYKAPAEAALTRKLASPWELKPSFQKTDTISSSTQPDKAVSPPSTLSSLASFSDRITFLESSLGISNVSRISTPILPTLTSLSSKITALDNVFTPPATTGSHNPQSANINLEGIVNHIQALTAQSDRLTTSRKAALQAAIDLRQSQLKNSIATRPILKDAPFPHTTTDAPTDTRDPSPRAPVGPETGRDLTTPELLGYEDQASKIASLYALLPRIQDLAPLLPPVLERLRSLQTIHTGAAQARSDLDRLEARQREMGEEITEWRDGLGRMEGLVREAEARMKENQDVVGGLVRGVEKRVEKLAAGEEVRLLCG